MRKLIYVLILFCSIGINNLDAQIEELKYLLQYNCETNQYDVNIKIMEGSASTVLQRIQFNSQLTILVPTGMSFEIVDRYQPLEDNQNYQGTIPNEWGTYSPIISPDGHEEYDFYSIAPNLTPASFFNNIDEGEEIMLFSFTVDGSSEYDDRIRFFNNKEDVELSFYEGADLRNGYSVGGAQNKYKGNIHMDCTISDVESALSNNIRIYPNPTNSKLFVETPENTLSIKMIDSAGKQIKEVINPISGIYAIEVSGLVAGNYFIQIDNGSKIITQQFSVF